MKKFFYVVITMTFIFTMGLTGIKVSAKDIVIERDDNPDGVAPAALCENYYIDADEETAYVVSKLNGQETVLGTCTVVVVDAENPNGYVLCSDQGSQNSYGEITIVLTNKAGNQGFVQSTSGALAQLGLENSNIIVVE